MKSALLFWQSSFTTSRSILMATTNTIDMTNQPKESFPRPLKKVEVILIKPSSYHSDGAVLRGIRLGIPCNSLSVLERLTQVALKKILPQDVAVKLHVFDDGVYSHSKKLEALCRKFPEKGTKLIVGLVGVQTMQFPRACDMASQWQKRGATVVIGGFHVSGVISTMLDGVDDNKRKLPCPGIMPPEIQAILDKGVVVFHGEAEEKWEEALLDILQGQQKQIYRGGQPDFWEAPLPLYHLMDGNRGYIGSLDTFDTSRGCPFTCTFCSIINVSGREMRQRNPQKIIEEVELVCKQKGHDAFFITDDNFGRNPCWEQILDGFIALRLKGYNISFMIEADLACGAIPNFLSKLAAAGCYQIFMGVESMNPENLREAHKYQNQVSKYESLWGKCHELGICVHAGYIIGFNHDTPESVRQDIAKLKELGADIVSFFILSPVPGSEDHIRHITNATPMDPDFNNYDSFQPVMDHPVMTRQEWQQTYDNAWREFYTVAHMQERLQGCRHKTQREALQRVYMLYCWAVFAENIHPMNTPLIRVRTYGDMRPGFPKVPYWKFIMQESWRYLKYAGSLVREFYRFQQVNLPVRNRLNEFWKKYAGKKWKLLWPWHWNWHVYAIPRLAAEVICCISSLGRLVRIIKA